MKKRGEFDKGGVSSRGHLRSKKKNERRIGGKALSLEAFANAKSRVSGYNPSLIKKQKEFYKNAKCISKFKKLIKQESQSDQRHLLLPNMEASNEDEIEPKSQRIARKKKNSLKVLGEEVERKRAEAEKARLEREAMLQLKKEEREKAEARRKFLRDKMFKRTRSGQPVMKYRIQHLLEGLQENPDN